MQDIDRQTVITFMLHLGRSCKHSGYPCSHGNMTWW